MAKQVKIPEIYNIPDGWEWKKLGELTNIENGYPFQSELFSSNKEIGKPLIRIRDVIRGFSETYTCEDCPNEYIIRSGDILIGMDGDFNVNKWNSEDALLNQRVCRIQSSSNLLNDQYLFYYLPIPLKFINANTPSVTVKHLSSKTISQIPIPIPPLVVQKQLVELLDREIARLDAINDKIQSVLDNSEELKQSILHRAFTGELTEKWRSAHKIELSSWQYMPLKEACNGLKYGTASKSQKEGIVAVIRMGNLQDGEINWDNLVYSNNAEDNEKYRLQPGAVLFNRTNSPELVGKTAIYRGEQPAIYAGYLIKLDYKEFIDGEYLNFIMNSPEEKQYCNQVKSDGVNQSNVSAAKIGEFSIPVPSLNEQHEIVRILNKYIANDGQVIRTSNATLIQLEATRQSILSKAFHGELIR